MVVVSYLQQMEAHRSEAMEKADVMERKRAIYDNMDIYLRNHFYSHLAKAEILDFKLGQLSSTFKVANIFKQIVSFGSYQRFIRQLMKLAFKGVLGQEQERALLLLVQNLFFIEQTLKYDPINFLDFCTQLRGRLLNDSQAKHLPDLCLNNLCQQENFALCYFESFHHSLKENPRIDLVTKMPGC